MVTSSMTSEEKVGQLFITGIEGIQMDGDMIHLLNTYKVGGIYYTEKNVKHPKQVYHLSRNLQYYSNKKHPLFIAITQNGGMHNAITKGVTPSLTQQDLGHINNRLYTKRMAQYVGEELHGVGINMNLGPHINTGTNSGAYSNTIDHVAKHGRAAIEGYDTQQVLAVAGNFPAEIDIVESDTPIYKTPLHSFDYVIRHGAKAIITKDALLTTPFLQDKLHYTGLIIQDHSDVRTASGNAAITAINAGADMILLYDTYKKQMQIMDAVLEAVSTGEISEITLNKAVEKIMEMKQSYIETEIAPFNRDIFANKRSTSFVHRLQEQLETV